MGAHARGHAGAEDGEDATRCCTTCTSRPYLGPFKLSELTPELIARWQADRIAAGAGRTSVLKALTLLGSILQLALESERIARNPVRMVRKVARPPQQEVRPLPPATVEAMRAASGLRDATLISVLAYAGLRPRRGARRCAGGTSASGR